MSKARKSVRKSRTLILGYLEGISSKIFSGYPRQLTDLVGRQHGVYALYKGSRLYYVGLATNLRGRIKQHLKDKHAGKWDKFSIYLVRKAEHIKELESIVMRISNPAGNASKGRLPKADNLKKQLDKAVAAVQNRERETLFGARKSRTVRKSKQRNLFNAIGRGDPTLASYTKKSFRIKGEYKGKVFRAIVNKSGTIRFSGKVYNSPSMAGKAARGRRTNGWKFWQYKNAKSNWVKLEELRNRK